MTNFLLLPELIYEVVQSPLLKKNANSTKKLILNKWYHWRNKCAGLWTN